MTNVTTRGALEDAILRIAMEYVEMPDLILTVHQVRRLLNLPIDLCELALEALVAREFLMKTRAGAFLRRSSGTATPLLRAS